ncbi:hypothetical protein R3I93_008847 [Phoxinus phoxinus]|uniref:Uncharacterized protein n=1 Tax=Phoxinus phoxinus TaxID=58324 RepID=A0AAN9D1J5_9TELE
MDSKISKATQSLTTAEDMRNQTKLLMQPYANWEKYLTPAPQSIALMGELVFISSSTDFSINKNSPKDGYKFIKYPDSFRACLMQVCNSGWWAFNEAHTSMDQIRLHTAQVPDYMKMAVKILFQGDDEVVKALLPIQLGNISVIADECLKLSRATEKRFKNVIKIIQELLQACKNSEHFYGEDMSAIKKKLEESKLREQSAQETKKRTEEVVSAMEKHLDEAHESYKKALYSLPGGWEMIAMDVVGGITQSFVGLVNGLTSVITHPVRMACSATTKIADTYNNIRDHESARDVIAEINAYSKSAEILNCVQEVLQLMNVNSEDVDIDWKKLYDQKNKTTNTDFIAKQFERISDNLQKIPDCPVKKQAQSLCKEGMDICNQLAKYAPDGKCDKDKSIKIIHKVLELVESTHIFDCKSKDITHSPGISPKPPMLYKEENKSENMSASQKATDNARFAIEQNRAQMNKTRENYEKYVENLEKNEKELTDILVTMRNCELKEIDFKTTMKMLKQGMDSMGKVQEQWQTMVHFFQMVSNIIQTSLSKTLKEFVSTSEEASIAYGVKLFSKDMLYTQAFQACNIASLVHMISGTYTDVSSKYLMDCVSSLGKLMVMDQSKAEFDDERQKFRKSCDEARKDILSLVQENKEEFDRKSTARLEKIDRELLDILPAAPPKKKKRIQEAVQTGFSEEEKEQYS